MPAMSWKLWGAAVLFIVIIAIAQPWTVRPIGWDENVQGVMTPAEQAAQIWDDRVAGATYRAIITASELGDAPELISAEGVIVRLDVDSSIGQAFVDLTPGDGAEDLAVQIGPVIRGSMLRDALGLTFADFDSQMTYARVSSALNERAKLEALSGDQRDLLNKSVRISGAAAGGDAAPRALVPTQLQILAP